MIPENGPPKRPPGQPKPLLDEDIAPVLARLDAWYAAYFQRDKYKFNPPATDTEIDAFERLIGLKLPQSYRQLYRWHDGEEEAAMGYGGHIYDLPLLPLYGAGEIWKMWKNKVLPGFGGNRYAIPGGGWPVGAVDPAYTNPRWIPLTWDSAGNYIGLDFDPWPRGRIGQVILYGRDQHVKVVLAESLGKFLEWIAGLLESGNFRLDEIKEGSLRVFSLKNPPTQFFYEGARILLGAPDPYIYDGQFTYALAARAASGDLL